MVSEVTHSSISATLARPWSAVASPVGRYGVVVNRFMSWCLAAMAASRSAGVASPRSTAWRWLASAFAEAAAAARSRSPGDRGDSSSTAAVPTTDASHQPASRDGMSAIVPWGVATGST